MADENRTRSIRIPFFVDEKENEKINDRMAKLGIENRSAYLRKMAIDGYIIVKESQDTEELKKICAEMHKIGVNINQISKRINETNHIYKEDMQDIKKGVDDIWQLLRYTLSQAR
jgi:alpha/beta superfamily hydrolase